MITKKICLLGGVCVGKTSLARRYVYSSFSDAYQSTIGVKIHKKSLSVDETPVNLMVWDIQGEDRYDKVLVSFLKGISGFMLVVDVTQPESVTVACELAERVKTFFGSVPYVLVYSKCDLPEHPDTRIRAKTLHEQAANVFDTSSLDGSGVEEAFASLAQSTLTVKKAA